METKMTKSLVENLKRRARVTVPDTAPLELCIEGAAASRIEQLETVLRNIAEDDPSGKWGRWACEVLAVGEQLNGER